ncbi:AIC_G0052770.mRNA.1.CDS.1 [Saccharomyces cerevisiae]|nr:AIC_G0052770.mRNA.1.CDS.1 [Saccharomyces cerevisiae]CAI6896604.1 AIC_G0052770.mRNA.1.CDS.1 [Saccharomyces cerevisiae]
MKDGAYLVNTARGAICVAEDVSRGSQVGKLAGYGGDVAISNQHQKDSSLRTMDNKDHVWETQ